MKKTITVEMAAGGYCTNEKFYAELALPARPYEMQDALQKLRITPNRDAGLRIGVCGCEILPELTDVRLDGPSIQEMNFLAQRLAQLPDNEAIALRGVWKRLEKEGLLEEPVRAMDLINMTYGLNTVMIASNVSNDYELGEFVLNNRDEADRIAQKHNERCIEDCFYYGFESAVPQITEKHFGDMLSFVRLNRLAMEIALLKPFEQVKLKAVLEHEKPGTLEAVQEVVDHLGEYQLDNRVGDADSYFKEYLLRHLDTRFDARWLDGLTVCAEGTNLMQRLGAAETDYGIVSARGGQLYALIPFEQGQAQEEAMEMTMGGLLMAKAVDLFRCWWKKPCLEYMIKLPPLSSA